MHNSMNVVSVIKSMKAEYPINSPFEPSIAFPEYPFDKVQVSEENNYVYSSVRESLFQLSLDRVNYNKKNWNPLGCIIDPGNKVLLKPNFVMHKNYSGGSLNSVITNCAVIRVLIDYVVIALKGRGRILIADAPQFDADWEALVKRSSINKMIESISQRIPIPIELIDLRSELGIMENHLYVDRIKLPGDPEGYVDVDLGEMSHFNSTSNCHLLRGSDYDGEETVQHHTNGKHEYKVSKSVLSADVFINIPKMKFHPKSGVSLSLKNIIGINGDKNYIPHYKVGGALMKGDEHGEKNRIRDFECLIKDWYKKKIYNMGNFGLFFAKQVRKLQKKVVDSTTAFNIRGGSWSGNDTLWRAILDLNTILFYSDKYGKLHDNMQRKYFCVIDGIISGEGGGPYSNYEKKTGCIIAGFNPVAIELITARFMGLDSNKIPVIKNSLNRNRYPLYSSKTNNIDIKSNNDEWRLSLLAKKSCFKFKLTEGWRGAIELG